MSRLEYGLMAAAVAGAMAEISGPRHVSYSTGNPKPLDPRGAAAPKTSKRRQRRPRTDTATSSGEG